MFSSSKRMLSVKLLKHIVNASTKQPSSRTLLTRTVIANPAFKIQSSFQVVVRFKGSKSKLNKPKSDSETEESDDFENELKDRSTQTTKVEVTSLRLDGIIKSTLGIARNKIETMFYESKIRVNGEKVTKKSVSVKEGDEIDVIKGVSVNNPNFLNIARVEILGAKANTDSITLKIRKSKSLIIENYSDKWQPS